MSQRKLYLVAYNVREAGRLRQALHIARDYATGGQKSVFECYLDPTEYQELIQRMESLLVKHVDRFFVIPLVETCVALGCAITAADPDYFYIG